MKTLKECYKADIKKALQEKFNFDNPMQIPVLKKIVISMGIAEASKDKNAIQDCVNELTLISGQKPIKTRAKKAISNFKLRQDQVIGLKVTLRGNRMYDFVERFCNIASPRIRDFRGFPDTTDGRGNLSLGLEDQMIFAELNLDKVKRSQGMNITFVTSAKNHDECVELLRLMGVPFKGHPVVVWGVNKQSAEQLA